MMVRHAWHLWILVLWGSQLRGQLMVNTIGAGRFATQVAVGRDGARNIECAVAFKPYSTFKLKSIALPLSVAGVPGAITLELAADAGAPSTVIESLSIKDVRATEPTVYTVTSVTHLVLEAYTQYWIVVRATGSRQTRWWSTFDSSTSTLRPEARREAGKPWSVIYGPDPPGIVVVGERSPAVAMVFCVK